MALAGTISLQANETEQASSLSSLSTAFALTGGTINVSNNITVAGSYNNAIRTNSLTFANIVVNTNQILPEATGEPSRSTAVPRERRQRDRYHRSEYAGSRFEWRFPLHALHRGL